MTFVVEHAPVIRRLSTLVLIGFISTAVLVGVHQYQQQRNLFIETQVKALLRQYAAMQSRLHGQLQELRLEDRLVTNYRELFPGCVTQKQQDIYARELAIKTEVLNEAEYRLERVPLQRLAEIEQAASRGPSISIESGELVLTSLHSLAPICNGNQGVLQRTRTKLGTVFPPQMISAMYVASSAMVLLRGKKPLLHFAISHSTTAADPQQLKLLPLNDPKIDYLLVRAQQQRREQRAGRDTKYLYDGRAVALLEEPLFGQQTLYYSEMLDSHYLPQFLRSNATTIGLLLALLGSLLLVRIFIGHVLRVSAKYYWASTFDFLTGLYNRRALMTLVEREIARAGRNGRPLCLLQLDIDFFKKINDVHGHDGGDEVLKLFASVLQISLRQGDIAARMGGEEFLLLLPDTDLSEATAVAARLLTLVRQARLNYCGVYVNITCSAGISLWRGPQDSLQSLLVRADAQLYKAKQQGRDRAIAE
jgi:diguanylate cyclase (GGDEF)-like protein